LLRRAGWLISRRRAAWEQIVNSYAKRIYNLGYRYTNRRDEAEDLTQYYQAIGVRVRYLHSDIETLERVHILRDLRQKNPSQKKLYDDMDRALTFLETFRHLYQLFVVQEEEIRLSEPSTANNMAPVAQCMGYKDVGAVKGWDHLLIHYHESVQLTKDIIGVLLEPVTEHLRSITVFSALAQSRWDQTGKSKGNLAVDFIRISRFFRGTRFWDDVLETLEVNNGELLRRRPLPRRPLPRSSPPTS
jgi:hypothetical protein